LRSIGGISALKKRIWLFSKAGKSADLVRTCIQQHYEERARISPKLENYSKTISTFGFMLLWSPLINDFSFENDSKDSCYLLFFIEELINSLTFFSTVLKLPKGIVL